MLEVKTENQSRPDLILAASIIRLFAASRPLVGQPESRIVGRYEGEQAAFNFLASLFEQMAKSDDPNLVLKLRDMG